MPSQRPGSVSNNSHTVVSLDDVRAAAERLDGVAVRTTLLTSEPLSELAGVPVYLKLENEQPTGAFKLRGAWNFVSRITAENRPLGVITYSSGNHGQAVAFAAKRLGLRAIVVMPETAPKLKIDRIQSWGGEVVFAGVTSASRRERALELAEFHGYNVVPPFDDPDIIAGQGTVGLEIVEQLPEVSHIAVPVGGGGLLAGVTVAASALLPDVDITGVEPEGSAALRIALREGQVTKLSETNSVADGLLPLAIGELPFRHVYKKVNSVVVKDDTIISTMRWLLEHHNILAEPSGAVTSGALRGGVLDLSGPTVLIVSGGNVEPDAMRIS